MAKFVKGQSGNPKGAPKRSWTWSGVLEEAVQEKDKDSNLTVKELVARSLIREARKGNVVAQKELMNRMDGMPKQAIEHEGDMNFNITLKREQDEEN